MKPYSIVLATVTITLAGCQTYKRPTLDYAHSELEKEGAAHPLYKVIPLKKEQIPFADPRYLTWALFGNADAGIFAEYHKTHADGISYKQFAWWTLRNPMHNFTFYVIGDADNETRNDITLINLTAGDDFKVLQREQGQQYTEGSGAHFALHNHKPFVGIKLNWPIIHKRTEFYLGWRPKGNFGLSLRPFRKNL